MRFPYCLYWCWPLLIFYYYSFIPFILSFYCFILQNIYFVSVLLIIFLHCFHTFLHSYRSSSLFLFNHYSILGLLVSRVFDSFTYILFYSICIFNLFLHDLFVFISWFLDILFSSKRFSFYIYFCLLCNYYSYHKIMWV